MKWPPPEIVWLRRADRNENMEIMAIREESVVSTGIFRFTILQLVAPTMPASDVIHLESSWKRRLHTRAPYGLNDN